MKRSRCVTLTILLVIATATMACDEDNGDIKHCVDENGVVQDESKCAAATDAQHVNPDGTLIHEHYSSGGPHFFWYYGGSRTPLSQGSKITSGGSYRPSPGRSYSPPSSVGRGGSITSGGFGGTGHGFSGGGE